MFSLFCKRLNYLYVGNSVLCKKVKNKKQFVGNLNFTVPVYKFHIFEAFFHALQVVDNLLEKTLSFCLATRVRTLLVSFQPMYFIQGPEDTFSRGLYMKEFLQKRNFEHLKFVMILGIMKNYFKKKQLCTTFFLTSKHTHAQLSFL